MADTKYEYSRITCVNTSREILTRSTTLRSFNSTASSCCIIDFLVLMAAITILLAHLDSSTLESSNLLDHRYHSDRAMIEMVQESFQEVNTLKSDALSVYSADLLRKLLAMEADITRGFPQSAGRVSVHRPRNEPARVNLSDEGIVQVQITCFGIIQITCDSLSTTWPRSRSHMETAGHPAEPQAPNTFSEKGLRGEHADPQMQPPSFDSCQRALDAQRMVMVDLADPLP